MPDDCVDKDNCKEFREGCAKFHEERDRRHTGEMKAVEALIRQSFASLSDMIVAIQESTPKPEDYKDIMRGYLRIPVVVALVIFLSGLLGSWYTLKAEIAELKHQVEDAKKW